MAKVRPVLGYIAAALTGPLVIAVFMLMASGALDRVGAASGLTIAPGIVVGEVVRTIDHGAYQAQVHRMVFDALIGERREGFIQVDWMPREALPALIDDEIDADGDSQADFRLQVNTEQRESTLTPYAPWVLELEGTYALRDALAVRVHLRNPSR
jgi:hypothetical protein